MTITIEELRAGTIDFSDVDAPGSPRMPPVHPGEILSDWMAEEGLSAGGLANALNVQRSRIAAIMTGKRSVSAETALRLARCLGTSPDLWINLQADYDRECAERAVGERIAREVTPRAA
jgi:addiction module HigA family antidote